MLQVKILFICYYINLNLYNEFTLHTFSVSVTLALFYRDITWTLAPGGGEANATVQRVHCRCRPGSVPYLVRRQPHRSPDGNQGFIYAFACSPQSVSVDNMTNCKGAHTHTHTHMCESTTFYKINRSQTLNCVCHLYK